MMSAESSKVCGPRGSSSLSARSCCPPLNSGHFAPAVFCHPPWILAELCPALPCSRLCLSLIQCVLCCAPLAVLKEICLALAVVLNRPEIQVPYLASFIIFCLSRLLFETASVVAINFFTK
uniref:Uncharacterized protein n=1 Tax=Junco hyemalis TaxID=40217 RepID=A0A8C5IUK2_JUNHY